MCKTEMSFYLPTSATQTLPIAGMKYQIEDLSPFPPYFPSFIVTLLTAIVSHTQTDENKTF